jgi:hypothetical protein
MSMICARTFVLLLRMVHLQGIIHPQVMVISARVGSSITTLRVHVQMCGAASLKDIVPEMVQGTDQVAAWSWNTGREHLPPFKLKAAAE